VLHSATTLCQQRAVKGKKKLADFSRGGRVYRCHHGRRREEVQRAEAILDGEDPFERIEELIAARPSSPSKCSTAMVEPDEVSIEAAFTFVVYIHFVLDRRGL
jgi:hypothetical protein